MYALALHLLLPLTLSAAFLIFASLCLYVAGWMAKWERRTGVAHNRLAQIHVSP